MAYIVDRLKEVLRINEMNLPALEIINDDPAIYSVQPVLISRRCGGWLAITPRGWPISIGVTADTEAEARREFEVALDRWSKIGAQSQ